MAEEAVDRAVANKELRAGKCRTRDLQIPPPKEIDLPVRLHPELDYRQGDVARAVRYEMAQTVEDVLARRTRALFLDAAAAIEAAPAVAKLMAKETGRDTRWRDEQTARFSAAAQSYLLKNEA